MLTTKDLQKISELVATKSEIEKLKEATDNLREVVQGLITAADRLAKTIENLRLEYAAIKFQLDRHERWIQQLAKKVRIPLEI